MSMGHFTFNYDYNRGCGAMGYSARPASRRLSVRILAVTDLGCKKQVVTAPLLKLGNRCECHGSSEMTIINRCTVSQ